MARRRNQIPSTSETNLYFANIMLIAFCVQPPAIFLHSGGKFPSCSAAMNPQNQRVDTIKREMFSQKSVRRFVGDSSAFVMGAMFLASALNRGISPRY